MLITKTSKADKQEIQKLWQEYFAFDDDGYTAYHFQHDYDNVDNYVLKEKAELLSCLQVMHHKMVVDDHIYGYDFIVGVVTKKEYRRQGYMAKLLQQVLKELTAPVILIQAYKPEIYRAFGFIDVYYHKSITIRLPHFDIDKLRYKYLSECDPLCLLKLYKEFTADKNAYCCRDLVYYQRKQELWQAMATSLIVLYETDRAVAYLLYRETATELIVEELVYISSEAAQIALAYFAATDKTIIVRLMENEHCFDQWQEKTIELPPTMALFNKTELFDLMQMSGKDLYFNEYE